jgi:uncharacterized protein (DUF608 family)
MEKTILSRRDFMTFSGLSMVTAPFLTLQTQTPGLSGKTENLKNTEISNGKREYNGLYGGSYLNRVAFPIGGIGAGMICLEGTGAISHVSVRNRPEIFNEPCAFAAISVKGIKNGAKVLEGPVPDRKLFGIPMAGRGAPGTSFGLPRFKYSTFLARFPFATVFLKDEDIPLEIKITGWSPFIPTDEDNSSLPVGALEYSFRNNTSQPLEMVFSYNAKNFMKIEQRGITGDAIKPLQNGFILWQEGSKNMPHSEGSFAVFVENNAVQVDHCWFRGGWWDPLTMAWKNIESCGTINNPPKEGSCPGASLYVHFSLNPAQEKTICLMVAWYVPKSDLVRGNNPEGVNVFEPDPTSCCPSKTYLPWYACKFKSIYEVAGYWRENYLKLRENSQLFSDTFFNSDLPDEVLEAVAANLTILKSPTVLRQADGRLWCWEGCNDDSGCCHGSCTHVWNYAQAIPHLFPRLERTLRYTEFNESQDQTGHQIFRSNLPIRLAAHDFHAAADGQLGGIMKVYREWRISGDHSWLKEIWPKVKLSLDYCIKTWDPKGKGILEEPHHNTYDIEYWGPNGHCTSFYLGALTAAIKMGKSLGKNVNGYEILLKKGKKYLETELFNGEYFFQRIQWEGLEASSPVEVSKGKWNVNYSQEALELLKKEGPKYQYGNGCLSDGILGFWIAEMCNLGKIIDVQKVKSHLKSVYKYNLKHNLEDHINPQRPAYALGNEGGLLICTWPKGGSLSLPFVYSNEVWTGIEYQVASHLMIEGMVEEGLDIVRTCRSRYDGQIRNPFNEYECGHWYARAMSSYGLIQGLTGIRYDAVEKTLYIDSKIGNNFNCFLSGESGFATVGLKNGKPFIQNKLGSINVKHWVISGKEVKSE